MMAEYVIETTDLRKTYPGNIMAVKGIHLQIKQGEIFGFLGPNGAGKTTTIKMLSTSITPTSGFAKVMGYDIVKDSMQVRRNIGVVPQDLTTDEDLKAVENLRMVARFYDLPKGPSNKKIDELLALVDLADVGSHYVRTFSGGMRKRLELIMGLVNEPKVLFLDEPTLGLDVQTRAKMWDYIKKIRSELGVTIILTTHYLEEADELSDRICIIDHGNIITIGTSAELKASLKGDTIIVETKDEESLKEISGFTESVEEPIINGKEIRLTVRDADSDLPLLMDFMIKNGITPMKMSVQKPSLDQVFLKLTGNEIREESGESAFKQAINMRRLRR